MEEAENTFGIVLEVPFDFFTIYTLSPTTPSVTGELEEYLLMRPLGFAKGHVNLSSGGSATGIFIPRPIRAARDILS